MPLNPSHGNMYSWVNFTWNTVKGACPHDCKYCFVKRWGNLKPVRLDEKELRTKLGEGNFIFVGSSCDMWANDIPLEWILKTIEHCMEYDSNRYLFQSKNPARFAYMGIYGWLRRNLASTLCTTIETNRWYPDIMRNSPRPEERADAMERLDSFAKYVTIEPIMDFDLLPMAELIKRCNPIQVNIGADSGRNGLPEPSRQKVEALIQELQKFTKIHHKSNLDRLFKEAAK